MLLLHFFHMDVESERQVDEEVEADDDREALRRVMRNWAERFITKGALRGYLAYVNDIPIGFCNTNDKMAYARFINETASAPNERTKVVACFVIAPEYRGQGIATTLLERVIADAKAEGYTVVEGYPKLNEIRDANNYTGPLRLHEKLGFTELARYKDRSVMRKIL